MDKMALFFPTLYIYFFFLIFLYKGSEKTAILSMTFKNAKKVPKNCQKWPKMLIFYPF